MKLFQQISRFCYCLILLSSSKIALAQQKPVRVEIDPKIQYQTIDGFGASDAWTCQFAGLWPDEKRSKIADLLFSTKLSKTGQPVGIGLNIWRFSIGAGSAAQGRASDIGDEWRRQLAFLQPDGSYDWNAMPGQSWFLKAAKTRGVNQFLGFVNSPNVLFTKNKKAYSTDGNCNLDFDQLDAFSADMVATVNGLKKTAGITLNYLSPANEPQWKWNEHNQEGCPYTNAELAKLYRGVNAAFSKSKLQTKIQIGEAGQLDYLYNNGNAAKGNQVFEFFNASSPNYIANLSNIDQSISGHSYFTTSPKQKLIDVRRKTADAVATIKGLKYWMSEYCVLGDDTLKGEKRDLGMVTALFVARLIHHDLVLSNASSWQWWLAVSNGDYKDGLVYIDSNKSDGQVYESKLLWALGNYSRFIKQGSKRVDVKMPEENIDQLYISAYIHQNNLVTVAVNNTAKDIELDMVVKNGKETKVETYVTSNEYSLTPYKKYKNTGKILIPAKSVTTIVSN
ncbi:glycoside hydrolase [Pedobacter sp. 22226]|uniref:glycoside hydrolase n=1 Tax=Pedobacter sp. 22226 TaxID=3453894 RepID=UPI003F858EAF